MTTPKKSTLRHAEYYDLTERFDKLYADSKAGKIFTNLMDLISSKENILMAYREIKRNRGSTTPGTDKVTIFDLEALPVDEFVHRIQKKFAWYKPRKVKRVEMVRDDGKIRPLGIPSMWDRIIQQCIKQVLEPICEARFYDFSNGFRPIKSAESAISQCYNLMNFSNLHYVVDIDIKGFFDNVNHAKLRKQMWTLGIQDKKLMCIISEMLRAPVLMPDGSVTYPDKGTPQGGVLSPLLSNIVLNELDWWIASQWHTMPVNSIKAYVSKDGTPNRGNENRAMRKTALKEIRIVRYADDFKLFCRTRSEAERAFHATENWLQERLKLEISPEKSKIVNLRKSYTDFLGFKIKAVPKGKKYVVRSHMSDKAVRKTHKQLKDILQDIKTPADNKAEAEAINRYNATVMGKHQYYRIATNVSKDCIRLAWHISRATRGQLRTRIKSTGGQLGRFIQKQYGHSKQLRFIHEMPIIPIGFIHHKNPIQPKRDTCIYTTDGRSAIHKSLGVDLSILRALMQQEHGTRTVEFMDNRISLYAAQYGKCAVTGVLLGIEDIHCHHRKPKRLGGTDRYDNLVIVHIDVHRLIHATKEVTIQYYLGKLKPSKHQLIKINKFRILAGLQTL